MKDPKIKIAQDKLDNNFLFYLFLKEINGGNGLTNKQIDNLLEKYYIINTNYENMLEIFINEIDKIKKFEKRDNLRVILLNIKNQAIFDLFIFALKIIKMKPYLLSEAKVINNTFIVQHKKINLLSLEYDTLSKRNPYYARVYGALLSLEFFEKLEKGECNFMSEDTVDLLQSLCLDYKKAENLGIETNQIFMLMFSESINQSIVSDAGSSYEDRILNLLLSIGLKRDDIAKNTMILINQQNTTSFLRFIIKAIA